MNETDTNSLSLVRAAAERGVAEAQLLYGQMLLEGRLVQRAPSDALHWFERAAKGGNVMAINMVGRCLDQGWGVARSPRMAMKWFRKAAEMGLDWGMYNLATLLVLGEGDVPEDRVLALYWLRKAIELGHVKSMNIVGGFYEDGWVVEKDLGQARELYQKAARGGDFRGQFNYARMLADGGDVVGALFWLKKVPETATPAFMSKMRRFLMDSPMQALRDYAATIAESSEETVMSVVSEPTAAGAAF
ncbi:MAG: tetratricopeptide repeat protein [Edaphobacter sp.]|uniref:tetratricopeptide repeat protein n=1 Tax=Edaphobacter sp. TaxID=1934404 RepID=UPI00239790B1|nr:tetratricopeptide repeat protein [Edaphobacter sp.]MDE1177055.1 tetratricopeptide repeat protein [Edaphobacter sp.]